MADSLKIPKNVKLFRGLYNLCLKSPAVPGRVVFLFISSLVLISLRCIACPGDNLYWLLFNILQAPLCKERIYHL